MHLQTNLCDRADRALRFHGTNGVSAAGMGVWLCVGGIVRELDGAVRSDAYDLFHLLSFLFPQSDSCGRSVDGHPAQRYFHFVGCVPATLAADRIWRYLCRRAYLHRMGE